MKLLSLWAAAAAVSLAFAGAAAADDTLAAVQSSGKLRIGTEGTYAPFTYHDSANALVGFDVEIGEAVAAKLGGYTGTILAADRGAAPPAVRRVQSTPSARATPSPSAATGPKPTR